jgi:hypothetical protein
MNKVKPANIVDKVCDKLEAEVAIGLRAQRAYDLYLKEFFETNYRELYTAFVNCVNDEDALAIRRLSQATKELHMTLERDINTGKMAAKQLSDMEIKEKD